MAATIRVRVRFFSHVRHVLGSDGTSLDLPPGSTAGDAEARLRTLAGGRLERFVFRLAVNHEYVSAGHRLADGDELALIAPVQGG
jgi:molybdopterin converting factor small subunit